MFSHLIVKLFTVPQALAAGGESSGGGIPTNPGPNVNNTPVPKIDLSDANPLGKNTSITQILQNILDFLVKAGAAVVVLMVIIGAFQMLLSQGDPEKFNNGKKTILYTVIGYAILLLADGIALIVKNVLSK